MSMTLNCKGKLLSLEKPKIMGILNITPDSFYDGGMNNDLKKALISCENMTKEGAEIIDIGAFSTRPFGNEISESEETERLIPFLEELIKNFPETIFSVDTFRPKIAQKSLEIGASFINDVSGGCEGMFDVIEKYKAPYVLMHTKGKPKNMQVNPNYKEVTLEVNYFFSEKLNQLKERNLSDVILDVGFGFGKTLEHNYELLRNLEHFKMHEKPILVGVSRKSMIYKLLDSSPNEALNGTTSLNTFALLKGANILRVHDVKEAKEVIKIVEELI